MTMPPKLITILCLVQFFFVSAGFLITRGILRIYDKVLPKSISGASPRIPMLSQFIRVYGLWLLLIPALWCVIAAARARVDAGEASVTLPEFVTGIVLTVMLFFTFALSALFAANILSGSG